MVALKTISRWAQVVALVVVAVERVAVALLELEA